jgi:hypothetical protein
MTDAEFASMKSKTYWPFDNESQWSLAERTLFPIPLTNSVIRKFAIEPNCPWIISGLSFKSLADLRQRLDKISSKGEARRTNSEFELSAIWPKRHQKGWPKRLSITEQELQLDGFQRAYERFIEKRNSESNLPGSIPNAHILNPMMNVYNSIILRYPLWAADEVAVRVEGDAYMGEEILPDTDAIINERIRAGIKGQSRRDCVLIRSPREGRGKPDTMAYRKVAQVLLFFTIDMRNLNERLELALISLFETKRRGSTRVDPTTGMFHVHRTKRLRVIEVNDIERGVHLIPKFGRVIGETTKIRQIIEEKRTTITWEEANRAGAAAVDANHDIGGSKAVVSTNTWLDALSYYDDFWLNVWVDNHIYKLIY